MIVECPACSSRYDVTGRPPGTKARCRCGQIFQLPAPEQSASALSCPQCGGNVASGASQCCFCEAALLVKACPRCFSRIFHGAKHCDQCGAEVDVPAGANADGTAKALVCPRCESSPTMVARLVGDTLMDECSACHGIWLDTAAVKRLVSERRQVSTQAVLGMGSSAPKGTLPLNPPGRTYLKCPDCERIMNRTNFAKKSGIIIDTCSGHGTWFDADELPGIIDFVMNGGIEAANDAEMGRMKREVRAQRAKTREAQSSSMRMDVSHSSKVSNAGVFGSLLGIIGSSLID